MIQFEGFTFHFASSLDAPEIRKLVNAAYKELADMGLNYTATYQDEEITKDRISKGKTFLLREEGRLIASVILKKENHFTGSNSAYVSQLAVHPDLKKNGLGTVLMNLCEFSAKQDGFEAVQLDTAKPAVHLVSWYERRGYKIVGETHWEGKTYDSWIFEKTL